MPADHPLRPLRELINEALKRLNGLFNVIYANTGRASIAPEKLMRALLLQVFYSVRSERMLVKQMRYNMLFRWFVGLAMEDMVWDHSVFFDGRTTRHGGYDVSQVIRKRIEEHFGWGKTVGRIRQTVYRGLRRVDQHIKLTMVASNLTRIARILFAVSSGVQQ